MDFGIEFGKIVLFYFLMIGIIDSPQRLRSLLVCLVAFDLLPTTLALLQYHEIVDIPAFTALQDAVTYDPVTGVRSSEMRLHATGNFGDPNDVCMILNTAMLFSLYMLIHGGKSVARSLWLALILVFGLALALTKSRGGFMGALGGFMVLFWVRYGLRKSIVLSVVALPAMFFLFSGRQTSLSTSEGTGQQRIQLWATGFEMLKDSPIWGVGTDKFRAIVGFVAHNSYIHAYAELGLFGRRLFFRYLLLCPHTPSAARLEPQQGPGRGGSPCDSLCHGSRYELRSLQYLDFSLLRSYDLRDARHRSGLHQTGERRFRAR